MSALGTEICRLQTCGEEKEEVGSKCLDLFFSLMIERIIRFHFTQDYRKALLVALFLIGLALYLGIQESNLESQRLTEEISKDLPTSAESIFLSNFMIAVFPIGIPFIGPVWHLNVQYTTGLTIGAFYSTTIIQQIPLTVFLHPVFILEYTAYVLALAESLLVSYLIADALRHGKKYKHRVSRIPITVMIVAALLFAAAHLETIMIAGG